VPLFSRRRIGNSLGERIDTDLAMFRGALARGGQAAHEAELRELVALGRPLRDTIRDIIHQTVDRSQYDRRAAGRWLDRAARQRHRLSREAIDDGYAGWSALKQAELAHAGRRASAVLVGVEDTGWTINENPRVNVRLRVEPEGEPPFEVERKLTVSRVRIPRAGERVEVFYDPEDRSRFTFRIEDLTDDALAGPDRIDQLARLADLRDRGILTDQELAAEKARLLEGR
jgi:hypothetical protein